MRMNFAVGKIFLSCLALTLSLGAAGCGGGDNANSANTSNTANRNAAGANVNAASSNTAVVTGTPAIVSGSTSSGDTALKNQTEANLTKAGISGVTVEVSDGAVTLKGSVDGTKFQDAVKAANEAGAKRVLNQLTRK